MNEQKYKRRMYRNNKCYQSAILTHVMLDKTAGISATYYMKVLT